MARFSVDWTLTITTEHADALASALAPETTGEHATLHVDDDRLTVEGHGPAGSCQHAMDDVLACLTGATGALESA